MSQLNGVILEEMIGSIDQRCTILSISLITKCKFYCNVKINDSPRIAKKHAAKIIPSLFFIREQHNPKKGSIQYRSISVDCKNRKMLFSSRGFTFHSKALELTWNGNLLQV